MQGFHLKYISEKKMRKITRQKKRRIDKINYHIRHNFHPRIVFFLAK